MGSVVFSFFLFCLFRLGGLFSFFLFFFLLGFFRVFCLGWGALEGFLGVCVWYCATAVGRCFF